MKLDDDNLDLLLSTHVNRALGSQVGRAETIFRQEARSRGQSSWRWWIAGTLATAAAVMWVVALLRSAPASKDLFVPGHPNQIAKSDPHARDLQLTTYTRTVDDGLVYLDAQTPVHQLRMQEVQQVRWLDDDGKTQLKVTVPKEQVLLVDYIKN